MLVTEMVEWLTLNYEADTMSYWSWGNVSELTDQTSILKTELFTLCCRISMPQS